ncbi:MAG: glycosyltransferase family 4 protein [Acidimicrobiales bacterium]
MRITVNTLSVTDENEGIRTMIRGLVAALVRLDGENRYRLICSRANAGLFEAVAGRVDLLLVPEDRRRPLVRILRDQVTVPRLVRRDTDLLLTPSTVGSLATRVPQVVMMVAHLALPSVRKEAGGVALSLAHRVYYGPMMRASHRRAAAVVAISEFLASRLAAENGLDPARVHAIPCGIDETERQPQPGAGDASPGHVLFVSTLYRYKNAVLVVRAIATARAGGHPLRAVIAGRDPDGKQIPALHRLAVDLGVEDLVVFAGKVSDDELERLYGGAAVVAFPSRAEGFGFVPLEAMARGIPVVVAARTSLPEVVAGAGLLVDPDDDAGLADALVQVVADPDLRQRLVEAGHRRAAELTWDRAARRFIELFRDLATPAREPEAPSGTARF